MAYQHLQPLAFRPINFESIPALAYHTLAFPERWYKELMMCWKLAPKNKNREYVALPVKSLNESILALIPDLVSIQKTITDKTWLYSVEPINTDYLVTMVKAWAITCLVDVDQDALQTVLDSFQNKELRWIHRTLSGGWQHENNGTARPAGEYYNLLPYQLAADLTTKPLMVGDRKLEFKRCPIGVGTAGSELVSWPPMHHIHGKQKRPHYFSIYIQLTLQTVAFQSDPVLYVHVGVRRYVSQNKIDYKREIKSALIHTPLSWLPGLVYKNSFQIARVRSRLTGKKDEAGKKESELRWDDTLEAIINKLNFTNPLPKAQELLNQLPDYTFRDTKALLIHNTSINVAHPVSVGLSATDKTAIVEALQQRLSASWTLASTYTRIGVQPKLSQKNPFEPLKSTFSKDTLIQRQERIKDVFDQQPLSIRIVYQKEATKNALISALESCLGFSYKPKTEKYKIGGSILLLHIEQAGAIASELDNKETSRTTIRQRTAYYAAKVNRLEEIRQHFPAISDTLPAVGALMELATKFEDNKDPKEALRQGMARMGYLTQFISADADEATLEHRAQRAVLDLLRQLGVLANKPAFTIKGVSLPSPLHIFGLWIVRRNSRFAGRLAEFPLLLHIHPDTGKISVKLPNSANKWVSYAQAQRALACMEECKIDQAAQMNHIRDFLAKLPANALLITHAQKLRGIWKSIANGRLILDTVDTSMEGETGKPSSAYAGLRLVRIREEGANEAPQVFAVNDDEVGLSSGVFAMAERVFASVGQKPGTATKAAKNASKLNSWTDSKGVIKQPNPTKYVWNHRVCEITVAAVQPEDNPVHWAAITHELRSLSLQFNDTTMLPLPLQLASLLEEYVTE